MNSRNRNYMGADVLCDSDSIRYVKIERKYPDTLVFIILLFEIYTIDYEKSYLLNYQKFFKIWN